MSHQVSKADLLPFIEEQRVLLAASSWDGKKLVWHPSTGTHEVYKDGVKVTEYWSLTLAIDAYNKI